MYGTVVIFGWKPAQKSEKVWGSPCTTQIVKQATLVFISSINHHLGWYLSGYILKMAACISMGISDPDSPAPRLQLFWCPLPLKVTASCGGGHSKCAYISYWDLGRIQQNFNWAQLNQIQGFRQAYCDSRSHYRYLELSWHNCFIYLCRVFVGVQQGNVRPPHSLHKVLHSTVIKI